MSVTKLMTAIAVLSVIGCGDPNNKRGIGSTCTDGSECASGFCADEQCLDPEADEDGDSLINRIEATLGTDIFARDSDGDGVDDRDELEEDLALKDTDSDGLADALESRKADADHDCIVDELDARNAISDGADDPRLATLCPTSVGVCAAGGLEVRCPDDLATAVCSFDGVADYEATEVLCDTLDNDCDATTDEGCASGDAIVGHWALDGDGQDLSEHGDHGTVIGAIAAPDRFGNANKALRFATPGDRVDVASTHHPLGEATVTYNIWVRPERGLTFRDLGLFSFGERADDKRSSLVLTGRGCVAYVGENNDASSERACAPGAHWSMFSIVKTGTSVTFYLDARALETVTTQPGQSLASSALSIGVTQVLEQGFYEPFFGVLDDLRVWGRALSAAELEALYREGGWQDEGTATNPAQDCTHIRDGGRPSGDGSYWIDPDGDLAGAPLQAYCDMTTDGGGWTLVWVYGFTNFGAFDDNSNAVTPIPTWPARNTTSPRSTTPPTSPTTSGAIDWQLWRDLGNELAIRSDLNDGIACLPSGGSLADGNDGPVECRTIDDVTSLCDGTLPRFLSFQPYGPSLSADTLYYYFDGNETDNWPTHDPCGQNLPQHVAAPAREGGALYLRPSPRPVELARQCEWLPWQQRTDGPHMIDPDGVGGRPAFRAQCAFLEDIGFTKVDARMRARMDAVGEIQRRFMFILGETIVTSPVFTGAWSDERYLEVRGRWQHGSDGGPEDFYCDGGGAGELGIGCADESGAIVADAALDADGHFEACLTRGEGTDCDDATLWTREHWCPSDDDSVIGLGGFSFPNDDPNGQCWWLNGPNGWLDGFTLDHAEIPPGGTAPSLRADNPETGNFIASLNATQAQFGLTQGHAYTLSFWAKAAAPRAIRVFVQPHDLSYGIYWEDLTLGTEWKQHELGFEVRDGTWNADLSFQLAESSTAAVWLDDVVLRDDGPSPCGGSPDNLVGNGDFAAGTTCWWPGNHYTTELTTFTREPNGGPDGAPAMRVEMDRGTTEPWHAQLQHQGVPLEAFTRYRLTFAAKAAEPRTIFPSVARWDLGLGWLRDIEHPVSTQWRQYSYDFVPASASPPDGANIYFDLADASGTTVWLADVRLERLEADPCAPVDGLSNPDFSHGFACWRTSHEWGQVGVYPSVSPDAAQTLAIEVSQNRAEQDYQTRIEQSGIALQANHGYTLRFSARADAARRGYTNIQEWPYLHMNNVVPYDTTWRDYEIPFLVTQASGPAGAKLEVGFGGPLATGFTAFDDFALVDHGPSFCERDENRFGNVGFDKSYLCWQLMHDWDLHRAFITSDETTSGVAPPSIRIEVMTSGETHSVTFRHGDMSLLMNETYRLRFNAKASEARTIGLSFFDAVSSANLFYQDVQLGTEWAPYEVTFSPELDASGTAAFNFLVGGAAHSLVWFDDVELVAIEVVTP